MEGGGEILPTSSMSQDMKPNSKESEKVKCCTWRIGKDRQSQGKGPVTQPEEVFDVVGQVNINEQ